MAGTSISPYTVRVYGGRISGTRHLDDPTSDPRRDEETPPTDDSYLLGATGVEEQVLAELARAEASINDPEEPD